jgi:hypothetical protein
MTPRFAIGDQVLWRGQRARVDELKADFPGEVTISVQVEGLMLTKVVDAATLAMHQRMWVFNRDDFRWSC